MRQKAIDSLGGERVTPKEVKSMMEEVGQKGFIWIKLLDEEKWLYHPVVEIGTVDEDGLRITTRGDGHTLLWDEIESVRRPA